VFTFLNQYFPVFVTTEPAPSLSKDHNTLLNARYEKQQGICNWWFITDTLYSL